MISPGDRPTGDPTDGGHYFAAEATTPSRPATVRLDLPDLSLQLRTDRGVFSAERVDPGTRVLLQEAPAPCASGTIADVGCGYGPITLALATRSPEANVVAVDVNERARELCRTNATDAGLSNVTVLAPSEVPDDLVVDELWSNPPIRIGKPALHALLTEWLGRLSPAGRAFLVVQKHLGADSLADWMRENDWTVERLASRQSYRVLRYDVRELGPTELKRLHRDWRRRSEGRLGLILDGVQGPFNVGGIIRTAAAYRVERIWLTERTVGPENAKVGRTALGTERFLEVERVGTAAEAAARATASGMRVIGLELADEARPLHQIDLGGNVCFMVGNEDHGISKGGLEACESAGFLPQLGRVGSLNVSTAASIAVYEWARQQWTPTAG